MTVEALKAEYAELPAPERAEVRQWILEQEDDEWDRKFAADVESGALDFLLKEVEEEKDFRPLSDLWKK